MKGLINEDKAFSDATVKANCGKEAGLVTSLLLASNAFESVVPAKPSASGSHVTSFQGNMECDAYIRKYLYVSVVMSSGMNMVPEVWSA